jgi:methylenetetrahydrofolate reductase (NADPH)
VPGVPRVKDYTTTKLLAEARGWVEPHDLALGCVADPFAVDLEAELALLGRKAAAGADFVQTQMVFDPDGLARFLGRARESGKLGGCLVYASVAVLRSRRMADYVNQALPGFSLPEAAYHQIAGGGGVELAIELAVTLAGIDGVDALHVMPLGDEQAAGRVAAAFRATRGAPVERVPPARGRAAAT